ncbi:hypothetical protein BS47DRAFT_1294198 [Hydnum rufescens UP504]|uniref:Uncharacterized protein n=1 Tax=Hydnum rufescens UP504 TaxID=1448309 RepID=A0A9P6B032_9AGAM|nr:hypothetical protein BS47DRAFT_1294198 [Hydnum rufescens UP504]
MSNNPFGDEELDSAWGIGLSRVSEIDVVTEALKKEAVLKDIYAAQADLRILLERVEKAQSEVDKLTSGNRMLQTYIDNLTKTNGPRITSLACIDFDCIDLYGSACLFERGFPQNSFQFGNAAVQNS